jgi:hypothetical protein
MRLDLRKLGFKTGRVVMPGLGLETRLEHGNYFRNDGVVDNFERHYTTLSRELNCPGIENLCCPGNRDSDLAGTTIQIGSGNKALKGDERAAVIFLKNNGYPENIFFMGHESVHALIYFGKQKELTRYINSQGFNIDPFKVFHHEDEDHIADIGGLVSLHRRGRDDYGKIRVAHFVIDAFLDSRKKKVTSVYH